MKLSTAIKKLEALSTKHGYKKVRHAKHGDLWRDENGNTINFGCTSTDPNFHRKVVRDMRRHGHDADYIDE